MCLRMVRSWACLARRPVQGAGDIAGRVLADASVPSQLGTELIELCISRGKSSLERLQQDEKVLRAYVASSKYLEGTARHVHHELSLKCRALADSFIANHECVDALTGLALESKQFTQRGEAALFLKW